MNLKRAFSPQVMRQKDRKRNDLTQSIGPGGACNPPIKNKNEDGGNTDIEHSSDPQPHHANDCQAFRAQKVIECVGSGHKGAGQQNDLSVGARVRQNGGGRPHPG